MNPNWKRLVDAATSQRTSRALRRWLQLYIAERLPHVIQGRDRHDDQVIDVVSRYLAGAATEGHVVSAIAGARAGWANSVRREAS